MYVKMNIVVMKRLNIFMIVCIKGVNVRIKKLYFFEQQYEGNQARLELCGSI